jgi:hypothetical protein
MVNSLLIQETINTNSVKAVLHQVLTFIHFLGHQAGLGIIKLIQYIAPDAQFPENVIEALGLLVIVTVFMILVTVAKKAAWVIVGVGWILLLIRILLIVFKVA